MNKLWGALDRIQKLKLITVGLCNVLSSVFEIVTLGLVLPLLNILLSEGSQNLFNSSKGQFSTVPGGYDEDSFLLIFLIVVVVSGLLKVMNSYFTLRTSHAIGADLAVKLYRNSLEMEFEDFKKTSSSAVISLVVNKSNEILNAIWMSLNFIGAVIALAVVLMAILTIKPLESIIISVIYVCLYLVAGAITKGKIARNGDIISVLTTKSVAMLQEGLGAFREIRLDGKHSYFIDYYSKVEHDLKTTKAINSFLYGLPKLLIESSTLLFILLGIIYARYTGADSSLVLGTIAFFGIAGLRILPLMQQLYSSLSSINSNHHAILECIALLNKTTAIHFGRIKVDEIEKIEFSHVSFKYHNRIVLDDVSFVINKGDIAFIQGPSGSGKSTIVDLLLGFIQPTTGLISVNGYDLNEIDLQHFHSLMAHIPQKSFLFDTNCDSNIVMRFTDKINVPLIRKAKSISQIDERMLEAESIGERGNAISGGQGQRLGIARAVYKDTNFIIMDEATSALDSASENQIFEKLTQMSPSMTIVFISHNLDLAKYCNKIIEIQNMEVF